MTHRYYVYLLIDPRTSQPFYVGKGCDDRMLIHEQEVVRNYNTKRKPHHYRIQEILECGLQVVYDKVLLNVTEEQALIKERELIAKYGRVNIGTGILLNLTSGGHRGGAIEKPISQYTLEGDWVADFISAKDASAKVSGANRSYITQVCKGKRKSAGGFLWAYKDAPKPTFSKKYHRAVQQRGLNGILIAEYRSLTEAQNRTGVELHNISECCRGRSKTAGGYVWCYINQFSCESYNAAI